MNQKIVFTGPRIILKSTTKEFIHVPISQMHVVPTGLKQNVLVNKVYSSNILWTSSWYALTFSLLNSLYYKTVHILINEKLEFKRVCIIAYWLPLSIRNKIIYNFQEESLQLSRSQVHMRERDLFSCSTTLLTFMV